MYTSYTRGTWHAASLAQSRAWRLQTCSEWYVGIKLSNIIEVANAFTSLFFAFPLLILIYVQILYYTITLKTSPHPRCLLPDVKRFRCHEESEKDSSHRELNSGHHCSAYCTGGDKCLSLTPDSHSACGVKTRLGIDYSLHKLYETFELRQFSALILAISKRRKQG